MTMTKREAQVICRKTLRLLYEQAEDRGITLRLPDHRDFEVVTGGKEGVLTRDRLITRE